MGGACAASKKKKEVKTEEKPENPAAYNNAIKIDPSIFVSLKKGTISSTYKIGNVLGEGAYGKVCVVVHKTTGIMRAMKTIKKSAIIKEEEERLFSEMNILKNLDHPNILKLYELFQDDEHYFLITEYCSGGELFDKIKSMNFFTEKMAADYMKQILSAIVYCHSKSIVHRDLKPENLLLESKKSNATLKVIDFGTSRKFNPNKKMSKRLGTPYYIAPEVLDQNYDEKCDVWSCGVILYILLCGYPPFTGNSETEILNKVRIGKFSFDPVDWEKVSDDAKNLIKKMLAYNPSQRITAQEALNDIWIQKNASSNALNANVLKKLTGFYARSKFKQAVLSFMATQIISNQDKEELLNAFKALDVDGDGKITKEELIQGYLKMFNNNRSLAEDEVDKIIKECDQNLSGNIDFTEFIVATMNKEKLLSKSRIEQTFKMFDQDQNGYISKNELENIMGGIELEESQWKQIILECDANGDGMISQSEFLEMLLKNIQMK